MKITLLVVSLVTCLMPASLRAADPDSNVRNLMPPVSKPTTGTRKSTFSRTAAPAKEREARAEPSRQRYTTVEPEEPSYNYFKGEPYDQRNNLFFGVGAGFFDSLTFQGRYAAQLLPYGFIPDVNDSFYVEGGLGLTFYGRTKGQETVGYSLLGVGRWDFQMDTKWTLFANLGFGVTFTTGAGAGDVHGGGIFPAVGVGAMYNFNTSWALRGDLSYQYLGIGLLYRY